MELILNHNFPPNEPVIITDNIEALKIVTELGIVDALHPEEGFNTGYYFFGNEVTHWGLASYRVGHENDKQDNGYMIIFVPKSNMTREQAVKFFVEMMDETSDRMIAVHKTIQPNINN